MLQEYKINDIVGVKLLSGDEIIGKIVERSIDSISLAKPIMVQPHQVGPTNVALAYLPAMVTANPYATIQVPFSGMSIRPVKCNEGVTKQYYEMTTGLVQATPEQTSSILSA